MVSSLSYGFVQNYQINLNKTPPGDVRFAITHSLTQPTTSRILTMPRAKLQENGVPELRLQPDREATYVDRKALSFVGGVHPAHIFRYPGHNLLPSSDRLSQ